LVTLALAVSRTEGVRVDSGSAGSQLKSSITEASRKIESIIDDAERAAAEIRADARADAEREAQRALNESSVKLSSVVGPLVERVENLRVEAAALTHEIDAATKQLRELTRKSAELGSGTEAVSTRVETPAAEAKPAQFTEPVEAAPSEERSSPGPVPVAYPGTDSSDAASSAGPPEEAVLRATQMAVAGSSRSEIEATLSEEFGLADATPVVNDILGPA
jgi:hypothetical protein